MSLSLLYVLIAHFKFNYKRRPSQSIAVLQNKMHSRFSHDPAFQRVVSFFRDELVSSSVIDSPIHKFTNPPVKEQ